MGKPTLAVIGGTGPEGSGLAYDGRQQAIPS